MLVRIDSNGRVDGVLLSSNQNNASLQQLANHQIISLPVDVIPHKQYTYQVPVTYSQDGHVHYNYVQVFNDDGTPKLDTNGNPIREIQTTTVSKNVTLLDQISMFTIDDVIQQKYVDMAHQNYFQNVYAKQFYIGAQTGGYDSGIITTNTNSVGYAVVHAIGGFKTIAVSNDGGNTFISTVSDQTVTFPTGGNGTLRVKFDVVPQEFGIMY